MLAAKNDSYDTFTILVANEHLIDFNVKGPNGESIEDICKKHSPDCFDYYDSLYGEGAANFDDDEGEDLGEDEGNDDDDWDEGEEAPPKKETQPKKEAPPKQKSHNNVAVAVPKKAKQEIKEGEKY